MPEPKVIEIMKVRLSGDGKKVAESIKIDGEIKTGPFLLKYTYVTSKNSWDADGLGGF